MSDHQVVLAATIGLDIPTVEHICNISSDHENVVQVANDNSPGQVVISGSKIALEKAIKFSREAGARRVIPLNVSIAAHSPLMAPAQFNFTRAIAEATIRDPLIPLIGNVSATPLLTSDQISSDLEGQLTNRVRWTESIQYMINQGIKVFFELGNKEVLTGLVKRIAPEVTCYPLGTIDNFVKLKGAKDFDAGSPAPFGRVGFILEGDAITDISFLDKSVSLSPPRTAQARKASRVLRSYFTNPKVSFCLPLKLSGTAFQQRVWRALRRIPAGRTLSYGVLARKLDTSARAVGNACRANPIPIIIPCRRVVASNGVGGFMGKRSGSSLYLKHWLLEHERGQ